jgi:hypothetical protein
MTIKFSCPHCKKALSVKDDYAGRRAACPACKTPVVVPAPVAKPADMEAFAAAALSDEPAAAAAAPQSQAKIEFTCTFCDEKVSVPADLAGKRTPCPECRRIVKVPDLKDDKPKDWREIDTRRPSAARPEPGAVLEGTWSTRDAGNVSAEALIEADAVPQFRRRLTWQQWVRRGFLAAVGVSVITFGAWVATRWVSGHRKSLFLARALAALDNKGSLSPGHTAELHRAVGDYYLAENNGEQARNQFVRARAAVLQGDAIPATERDWLLIDILLSQVELGGDKIDVTEGRRVKWDDMQKEFRQTSQNLRSPEARAIALRALTRQFIEKGLQAPTALASQFADDQPQLLPAIGLELLRAGKTELATSLAAQALAQLPNPKADEDKAKAPAPSLALIVLLVALRKDQDAAAIAPFPEGDVQPDTAILVGYVEGWARRGDIAMARKRANEARFPLDRFQALMAVAGVELDNGQTDDARKDLETCLQLADGELKEKVSSPWILFRLVRLSAQAGLGDKAIPVAKLISDVGLRGRAQLEILRHRLAESSTPADEALLQIVDKSTPAHALALEAIARHNTRTSGYTSAQKLVENWDPPEERPLGDIGVALGSQASGK